MKTNPKILIAIITLSILLRLVAGIYLGDQVEILPGTYDQVSYHALALRVLSGQGFSFGELWWPITAANAPTAHWSFLYTLFLAAVYALFGPHPLVARLIQALLVGLFQPLLIYLIARRVFNEIVGLVSAVITAVYIYFIYYSATLMTEPFYITAILAALYFAIWLVDKNIQPEKSNIKWVWLAAALGIILGVVVLLRQLFLIFIPFLFLWIWWASGKPGSRKAFSAVLLAGFVVISAILPFSIYNSARFGQFVLLNTNAGYAFFWANHPIYGTHFIPILPPEMGSYQSLIPVELRQLSEAELDRELLKRGLQFVIDDPIRYIRLSFSRIPAFFMFWPSTESGTISNISRVFSYALFLPFMIYGMLLALLDRKRKGGWDISAPLLLLIVFVLVYTAIHLLTWALIRYRLPVDAVMIIFAGLGVYDLVMRLFKAPLLARSVG
jgi:4-amino-4-deoxy-L-arabinose transferase-like glycosyltransferase